MTAKPLKPDGLMDEREFRETIKDVVSSQSTIAQSQARTEGTLEGIRQTLETLIAAIGDVSALRVELARLQERDKYEDPRLTLLRQQVVTLEVEVKALTQKEQRTWVEGIARAIALGSAGGALTLLGNKLLGN